MLEEALSLDGPSSIRVPKTLARQVQQSEVGSGLEGRLLRRGDQTVCILGVGKMVEVAQEAAEKLAAEGIEATVWDVRVVAPADPRMLADAANHSLVVTVEDGIRIGGAGTFLVDAMRSLPELVRPLPPVRMLGLPLEYIPQAKPDKILAKLGLDAEGIANSIKGDLVTEQERLHLT